MVKKLALSLILVGIVQANVANAAGEYEYCMKDASLVGDTAIAECMKEESKRLNQDMYAELEAISKNQDFVNWNNGTGMFRGRLKNIYDNWAKYRDDYCSLYTLSMENYLGSKEYNMQRCVLDLTKNQVQYIKVIQKNRKSDPE